MLILFNYFKFLTIILSTIFQFSDQCILLNVRPSRINGHNSITIKSASFLYIVDPLLPFTNPLISDEVDWEVFGSIFHKEIGWKKM